MAKTLIMIPVYNGEDYLERTLRSCINQTLRTEVLIVDNMSTDRTREIVQQFMQIYDFIKLVINEENLGRVGNWNRCLSIFKASSYEYIRFLFVGDELLPWCIEELEKVANREKNLSAIAWPYYFVRGNGYKSIDRALSGHRRYTKEELAALLEFPCFSISGGCAVFSKWAVQSLQFDEVFTGSITFLNAVVTQGDIYHIDRPLHIFHLEARKTFDKQFTLLYTTEYLFTRTLCLERMKPWMKLPMVNKLRNKVYAEALLDMVHYLDKGFWKEFLRLVIARAKKVLYLWQRQLRTKLINITALSKIQFYLYKLICATCGIKIHRGKNKYER